MCSTKQVSQPLIYFKMSPKSALKCRLTLYLFVYITFVLCVPKSTDCSPENVQDVEDVIDESLEESESTTRKSYYINEFYHQKLRNTPEDFVKFRDNNQKQWRKKKHPKKAGQIPKEPKDREKFKQKMLDRLIVKILNEFREMDPEQFETRLQNIAIPRKVGSSGHRKVRKFIENTLHNMSQSWTIREDRFWVGSREQLKNERIRFRNIVATYEPSVCQSSRIINPDVRRIVLACHYDSLSSKFVQSSRTSRKHKFIGAIDAAVPCTILLDLAQVLTKRLEKYHAKASTKLPRLTVQLIFFDGEESLGKSPNNNHEENSIENDSLFGSKHLAKLWDRYNSTNLRFPRSSKLLTNCEQDNGEFYYKQLQNSLYRNENIVLFILLDLIGIHGTKFYNTNLATTGEFFEMSSIEKRLLKHTNLTDLSSLPPKQLHTNPPILLSLIKDDHRPFMIRGIPTMALIPHPFPAVWHRLSDNMNSLDFNAIQRFKTILTIFIANKFRTVN